MATILITGANRGIGLALTQSFLKAGHTVHATARNPQTAIELNQLASPALKIHTLDVTSPVSVTALAKAIGQDTDAIDVLINNAGTHPEAGNESFEALNLEHLNTAFQTNVLGSARMCQAFLPFLRRGERPRLVNISSGAASMGSRKDFSRYCYGTSKAALNRLTLGLALEMKPFGITVVALSPGWVRTDMGGPDAPLDVSESAEDIRRTVENLQPSQAGQFLDRNGVAGNYVW